MSPKRASNLSLMFKWRDDNAWERARAGDKEEGFRLANELLLEPRLGDYHAANMHLLLTKSDHGPVAHGREAIRLYTRLINDTSVDHLITYLSKKLNQAQEWLEEAQEREATEKERWAGMTDEEIVDAKIAEALKVPVEEDHEGCEDEAGEGEADQGTVGRMRSLSIQQGQGKGRPKGRYDSGFQEP
ncbi:uncharacterized protein J3D65DRAFT_622131 [Phyllosticta citribraziliensis]|uniref:Uncharacterized protein n=1 Tax=Phyllosticta citribraziliensis TaxID=989973 RepID=A0ABR1LTI2_9PEZI